VIARAHGVFSVSVVVASLASGALRSGGATEAVPFLLVAAAGAAAGSVALTSAHAGSAARRPAADHAPSERPRGRPGGQLPLPPLLVIGGLGAVTFAVENAHQSWSAVYLDDVLSHGPLGTPRRRLRLSRPRTLCGTGPSPPAASPARLRPLSVHPRPGDGRR
jgi:Alphavirus glycoprotein J